MGDGDDRAVYLELYRQSISEAHRAIDRQFELFETNRAALEGVPVAELKRSLRAFADELETSES